MTLNQKWWLGAVAALATFAACASYRYAAKPEFDHNHVFKIGFGGARPLHFADEDGNPAGLAVGVVREAARRKGIQLKWVQSANPGLGMLQSGEADLWILVTDLPERHKVAYITEPYLTTEYCFLVSADSPFRKGDDLANGRISYAGFGSQKLALPRILPKASLNAVGSPARAFDFLLEGRADAAFLDQYSAGDLLLSGGIGRKMRIIPASTPRTYMGLASTFESQYVADGIRDEMRVMAAEGALSPLFEGWGFFPGLNLEAMDSISLSRRRERFLILGVATLILLLACSLILVVRLRRQRSRLKRVESALRESEDRFRSLSNASLEGILIHAGGAILDANPACARLFGYGNPDELIGANPTELLLDSESRERIRTRIERRETGTVEVTAVRKDGSTFPAESETREMRHLGRDARLVAWRDLTAQKLAMAALRESEERYQALFDRSLDCVFLTDFEGNFLDANQAALDMLGYQREDIRTVSFSTLLSQDQIPEAIQAVHEVLTLGFEKHRREFRVRRKDGSWVFVETHSSLIYREGKPFAMQGIARNITDRKLAEEETVKLQSQLHQANKMESIGRLAGGVAHDFNNLLTVILGYSDMVLSRMDTPNPSSESQVRKALDQISRAATRAAALTGQLLLFSRRNPSAPKTVRLNDIVLGVEGMLRPLIGEHIEVAFSPGQNAGSIHADPGLVEQVLVNLAVNARDAMPEGGQLIIETSRAIVTAEFAAECISVPKGNYVALWVTDTGTGMTPEVQARVFEPFFTTKDPGRGTGLGLATVYGIVKQSGAYITLHSTPGVGTAFRILFPSVDDVLCQEVPPRQAPALNGTETVLLVEDEMGVRKFIRDVLEQHGYRVLDAAGGVDAIETAGIYRGTIDLLLTDVVLPGMKETDVIAGVRRLRPSVPVLRISGYPERLVTGTNSTGSHKGISYLQKPFTPEALLSRIRRILDRHQALTGLPRPLEVEVAL